MNQATVMATDIFLSYARQDTSRASELVTALEDEGWSIWWDRKIYAGRDFESEIDDALTDAKIVLVLWTSFSISSDWVRAEAREAKDLNKLLPVLLDEVRTPLSFRTLNTINLFGWPETKSAVDLQNLKMAVIQLIDQANKPSATMPAGLTRSTSPTLSMRVANRVADVVNQEISNRSDTHKLRWDLSLERYVNDFCLDLTSLKTKLELYNLEERLLRLGDILGANSVVNGTVDFDTFSIQSVRVLKGNLPAEIANTRIGELINEYCSGDDDFNLDFSGATWRYDEVLCLPLPDKGSMRDFIWFLDPDLTNFWTEDVEAKLLQLTSFLNNIRSLANERRS